MFTLPILRLSVLLSGIFLWEALGFIGWVCSILVTIFLIYCTFWCQGETSWKRPWRISDWKVIIFNPSATSQSICWLNTSSKLQVLFSHFNTKIDRPVVKGTHTQRPPTAFLMEMDPFFLCSQWILSWRFFWESHSKLIIIANDFIEIEGSGYLKPGSSCLAMKLLKIAVIYTGNFRNQYLQAPWKQPIQAIPSAMI